MRVGGEEANIKIGLADLIIAAAPALKVLANYDRGLQSQIFYHSAPILSRVGFHHVVSLFSTDTIEPLLP